MITGTKEWATSNLNIATGCEHDCRYCYARHNAVNRFKTVSADDWPKMKVNQAKVDKQYRKRDGVIMFPSSHDITPSILDDYCIVLRKLLEAGNQVLVITKPHLECIREICDSFQDYKKQILFRFTIGTQWIDVSEFWEPNAPTYSERIHCLGTAYKIGFATSVSCEPFLDDDTVDLYNYCLPYITDSFWIGKLNSFNQRVNLDGVTGEQIKKFVNPLKEIQSDEYVMEMYNRLDGLPFIRWKDSIMEVVDGRK